MYLRRRGQDGYMCADVIAEERVPKVPNLGRRHCTRPYRET